MPVELRILGAGPARCALRDRTAESCGGVTHIDARRDDTVPLRDPLLRDRAAALGAPPGFTVRLRNPGKWVLGPPGGCQL